MIHAPPAKLGCDSVDCICNGGQLPMAISAILSCGQASCTPGPAIATATNVVSSYCHAWSQTALPQRRNRHFNHLILSSCITQVTSILTAPKATNTWPTSYREKKGAKDCFLSLQRFLIMYAKSIDSDSCMSEIAKLSHPLLSTFMLRRWITVSQEVAHGQEHVLSFGL